MAMASMKSNQKRYEEDKKIPVFTVLKNGSILKNIFVINKPPPPLPFAGDPETPDQEYEEIMTVGRHPECNIMLTHPSISRFHLQINSKPSSQSLSVTDLSSVHGTWVSEKRVEPGATVALSEGDTLRVGGSTRVYRLHWVPLSRAYDMDHPFVPDLNVLKDEDSLLFENNNIEENEKLIVEGKEETCQNVDFLVVENNHSEEKESLVEEQKEEETCQEWRVLENKQVEEIESLIVEGKEDTCQGIDILFSHEGSEVIVKKEIPSAPPMPENLNTSFFDDEWKGHPGNGLELSETENLWCGPVITELMHYLRPVGGVIWETGNQEFSTENQSAQQTSIVTEVLHGTKPTEGPVTTTRLLDFLISVDTEDNQDAELTEEAKSLSPLRKHLKHKKNLSSGSLVTETVATFLSAGDLSGTKSIDEYQTPESTMVCCQLSSAMGHTDSPKIDRKTNSLLEPLKSCSDEEGHYTSANMLEEYENKSVSGKDHEWMEVSSSGSKPLAAEPVSSSLPIEHVLMETTDRLFEKENRKTPQYLFDGEGHSSAAEVMEENENKAATSRKKHEWREISSPGSVPLATESVNSSLPVEHVLQETTDKKINKENQKTPEGLGDRESQQSPAVNSERKSSLNSIWSRRGKPLSVKVQTDRSRGKIKRVNIDAEDKVQNEDAENRSVTKVLFSSLDGEEEEIFTPDKENFTPNTLMLKSMRKKAMLEEIKYPESYTKALLCNLDGEDEEIFTPDKENFTPNTLLLKSMKKKAVLEEMKHPNSSELSSSRVSSYSYIKPEENILTASYKKNQAPKILQERKSVKATSSTRARLEQENMVIKKNAERVPFQSLQVNSAGKIKSEASVLKSPLRNSNTVNSAGKCISEPPTLNSPLRNSSSSNSTSALQKSSDTSPNNSLWDGKRTWNMVVDTATLLDKESMKSLKLLQGLKGTHLVIPRMVLRELDCLKRYGRLFRSNKEAVSALKWIEECMAETKCWIHVESSMNEGSLVAQTPPASPQLSGGCVGFPYGNTSSGLLSARASLTEVFSPTAEDNIVECALLFQKIKNDGQLVLLSNDVTTKIKAMAEGLICETAEEFRESLVNPFSERFLWADSSPRGQTWSYLDDVVLWEKYNHCPSKKSWTGESAKGLKLILLHNSRYGQISSVR